MNWWVLVVLLGVAVMVIGPVMMLQPSARDRSLTRLRQRAAEAGLEVRMRELPRQATDLEAPGQKPAYRLAAGKGGGPREPWVLVRAAYEHESHLLGHWAWQGAGRPGPAERRTLETILPTLPKSARAVEGDATGWAVYWDELGGESALEKVTSVLRALRDPSG